jgi:hypothetical protein
MSLYLGEEKVPAFAVSVFGVSSVNGETGDVTGLATEGYVNSVITAKQDKLTGLAGQIVGFDENGNAVAQKNNTLSVVKTD